MKSTYADTLSALLFDKIEILISQKNFRKLTHIASFFPSLFSYCTAFETRLWRNDSTLDLFFCIEKEKQSVLIELDELIVDDNRKEERTWKNIQQFYHLWMDPDSELFQNIDKLFFEFDVGEEVSDTAVPAVFMQINKRVVRPNENEASSPKLGKEQDLHWIIDGLCILKNGPISPSTIEKAYHCFSHILPGTYIDHIAIMASRTPDTLRINVTNLQLGSLKKYLTCIGLEDRLPQIVPFLSDVMPYLDHLVLAIDVSDQILPRIGIELRLEKEELNLEMQKGWVPILDLLVAKGYCTPEKRDGLLKWVGRSREIFDPVLYRFMIYRFINLLKVVFLPNQQPTVKGYFSFTIHPFS